MAGAADVAPEMAEVAVESMAESTAKAVMV